MQRLGGSFVALLGLVTLLLAGLMLFARLEENPMEATASALSDQASDSEAVVGYAQALHGTAATSRDDLPLWLERIVAFEPRLSRESAEAFLAANGRTAANLIAASAVTYDHSYLHEALEAFPDDPAVQMLAAQSQYADVLSEAEREQALSRLETREPNNAAIIHLRLLSLCEHGRVEEATQLMNRAVTEAPALDWDDHDQDVRRALQNIYTFSGTDPLTAEFSAQAMCCDMHALSGLNTMELTYRMAGLQPQNDPAAEACAETLYDYATLLVNGSTQAKVHERELNHLAVVAAENLARGDARWQSPLLQAQNRAQELQQTMERIDRLSRLLSEREARDLIRLNSTVSPAATLTWLENLTAGRSSSIPVSSASAPISNYSEDRVPAGKATL